MRKKIQAFEKVCLIISPARFLPVLIRLYQHQNEKQVPISIRIQNKDFKQSILGKKTLEDIIKFIENNTKLLSEFQTLMLYDENKNPNGLPYPLLIKMINEAPELLFMVLYRLRIYEDFKNDVSLLKGISQEEKNKVIFLTLTLYWFFAGTPRKKYPQLLSKIFPAMQVLPFDRFYSYETLQSATLNLDRYEHSLVFYNEVESWINTKDIPNNYKAILENRDFLLYAQRKALSTWFSN